MQDIFQKATELRNQGQSLKAAEEYLRISQLPEVGARKGEALHMAAVSKSQSGQHEGLDQLFKQAKEFYKNDKPNLARVLRDEGIFKLNKQEFESAKKLLQESSEFLQNSDVGELAMSQSKLAVVLAKLKQESEAQELCYQAIQSANKSSNSFYVATAYADAGRVFFILQKPEFMPDCLLAALGALSLESDPHTKRKAELYLGLNWAYKRINNLDLARKAESLANQNLQQLDEPTAERIRGFFKD